MKLSISGLEFIKKWEGYLPKASNALDGVWTIGYGHTKGVKSGDSCTPAQALQWLKEDVAWSEDRVNKYMEVYHFNQNQFDALVSFAYNIGSIDQLTANGRRTLATISEKMLLYVNCNGKPLQGLRNRRAEEQELFLRKPIADQTESNKKALFEKSLAGRYKVNTKEDNLNMRKEPDGTSLVIGSLKKGSTVLCYGYHNGNWLYVQENKKTNAKEGYCFKDYLVRIGDL